MRAFKGFLVASLVVITLMLCFNSKTLISYIQPRYSDKLRMYHQQANVAYTLNGEATERCLKLCSVYAATYKQKEVFHVKTDVE